METSRQKSLAASAGLHLLVVAALLINWPWTRDLKVGSVVPVNIVSTGPSQDLRPAVEAPEEQSAMTEAPEPDAPLETPAPEPTPEPPAPPPKAAPTPAPKPAPPTPAPKTPPPKPAPAPKPTPAPKTPPQKAAPAQKAAQRPAEKELDLDSLLAGVRAKSGGRPSSAQKGPTRAETATQARPTTGTGLSASALAGLTDELQRRWNPNCDVEGGRDVRVQVIFTIGSGGGVQGQVTTAGGEERSANPVVRAGAERAIAAVYGASPFRTLPRDFYGQRLRVNFNAREACT